MENDHLGGSLHGTKGVADHLGGFFAWSRKQPAFGCFACRSEATPSRAFVGKPRKVDSPKKKKVEKPQDGRQKSGQNIGNPYQMEDNKAAPSAPPQGGGASRRSLGVLVVFNLVILHHFLSSVWLDF